MLVLKALTLAVAFFAASAYYLSKSYHYAKEAIEQMLDGSHDESEKRK